jgi:hypothetical protein
MDETTQGELTLREATTEPSDVSETQDEKVKYRRRSRKSYAGPGKVRTCNCEEPPCSFRPSAPSIPGKKNHK